MLGVEGIADDDFSGSVRPSLLEVVSVRYSLIIVAAPTGFLGAVRELTFNGKRVSIVSSQGDLLVERVLGCGCRGAERQEKQSA